MILGVLDLVEDNTCIIDSLPVPVVQFYHVPQASTEWAAYGATFGTCASRKQTNFGFLLPPLITLNGVIRAVVLALAHVTELMAGMELFAEHQHLTVLGDKGSISATVAATLHADCGICHLTIPRCNQQVQMTKEQRHRHNQVRQLVETVNRQLVQQLHSEINHAHHFWGLTARTLTKLTAHTLCIWLNRLLGVVDCLYINRLALQIEHNSQV